MRALTDKAANALSSRRPRWGWLVSLLAIGGVLTLSVAQETPVGRVVGRASFIDSGLPAAHAPVYLTSLENGEEMEWHDNRNIDSYAQPVRRMHTVTDSTGNFTLKAVPIGGYRLVVATTAHRAQPESIDVLEDQTSTATVQLERSEPDLLLTLRQSEFTPHEPVTLPLHGYSDARQPAQPNILRVTLFRTRYADLITDIRATSELLRLEQNYQAPPVLAPALLHPATARAPVPLGVITRPLTGVDQEGFFEQRLSLGVLPPGLYLVQVNQGSRSVTAALTVTDTALVVKHSGARYLAYAVNSSSGQPLPGAAITLVQNYRVIATATTDARGLATVDLAANGPQPGGVSHENVVVLADCAGSEATTAASAASNYDEAQGRYRVGTYTERTLYRPGDTVFYKGIVRRAIDPGIAYAVPAGQSVQVEARDPRGGRINAATLALNSFGSYHGQLVLSGEAPTGVYSVVTTVDGEEHTADFTVAAYSKPEFTATVSPNAAHYTFGDQVEMFVDATYYFGAGVAGGRLHYTIERATDWRSEYAGEMDDYDDNAEDGDLEDDYDGFEGTEEINSGDIHLDANGHALITFAAAAPPAESNGEPASTSEEGEPLFDEVNQDQVYSLHATVTDASGRMAEAEAGVKVTAGDFTLRIRPQGYFARPDIATTIALGATDFGGKPQRGLPLTLQSSYRVWNRTDKSYREVGFHRYSVQTDASGLASVILTPHRSGLLQLTAHATDSRGHRVSATRSLWVAGDEGGDYDAQYTDLALLADKKQYHAGDTARVLINSQRSGGTALVTVEGSRLFRAFIVPLRHHSTALRIALPAEYGPNVTLAACTIAAKTFASSRLPLRVAVPQRDIRVAITTNAGSYRPGQRINYALRATLAGGAPAVCELSFGVVDEAIYALREDDPHLLRDAFYPQVDNAVSTCYSFEPLYLGDVNKAPPHIVSRSKFRDTAFWQPSIITDASGRASVSFILPDNLTTWRATAVAQTQGAAFGRTTRKVIASKPFSVRLAMPRLVTSGDATFIQAIAHNQTAGPLNATLTLTTSGLTLSSASWQRVTISAHGMAQVAWPVTVDATSPGSAPLAQVRLEAIAGGAGGVPGLTDGVTLTLPVRAHGRTLITNQVGELAAGREVVQSFRFAPHAMLLAGEVNLRVSPSTTDSLLGALDYLTGFPYGCTEQTMSRFLPDILVQKLLRTSGRNDARSRQLAARLPRMVNDGMVRLARMQHQTGAWGWWEFDADDAWMTAYTLYGLARAQSEGYEPNPVMVANGRSAAFKMLPAQQSPVPRRIGGPSPDATHIFLLYALALGRGKAHDADVIAQQRRLLPAPFTLDSQALGYLVLLDKQLGRTSTAWATLSARLRPGGAGLRYWQAAGNPANGDWNDKTATALGLRAMLAAAPSDARRESILLWLMTRRSNDAWGSTRDTAFILDALCVDLEAARPAQPGSRPAKAGLGRLALQVNGHKLAGTMPGTEELRGEFVVPIPRRLLHGTLPNTLTLRHIGGGEPFFTSLQVRQTMASTNLLGAVSPPLGSGHITLQREYRRIVPRSAGAGRWALADEPIGNRLRQGDNVKVRLTLQTPQALSYVLVEDAYPAGCEPTERGTSEVESHDDHGHGDWWDNTEVRDDRIAFFARRLGPGRHVIEYTLRAQTAGSYSALPAAVAPMYAPDLRAESAENRILIDPTNN